MSILFLVRSLGFGGAERQVVELAKGFSSQGFRVVVMVFYAGGPLLADLMAAGGPVTVLGKRGRWDIVRFLVRLVREVRRERPTLIYSFLVEPGIAAIGLKAFVPGVRVIWGVLASNTDLREYDWFPRVTFRISCWLARFADLIIVNSRVGAEHHQKQGYPEARIVVLPSGVDVARFKPDAEAGHRQRESWGIPASDPVVGIVGRLDPMKDHASFFQAAAMLRQRESRPWLVCVGEGRPPFVAELVALARSLGLSDRVVWAGTHQDMVTVYNAFDIMCSSSAFGEGWSNALGEAMACGIPCVATDVGDAQEILGTWGVLVPPRDPERLAKGLEHGLARLGDDVKRACRQRIVELFSRDRMVAETERLMRRCVDASA